MQAKPDIRAAHMGPTARDLLSLPRRGIVLSSHESALYCRFEGGAVLLAHDAAYGSLPFGLACAGKFSGWAAPPQSPVVNDPAAHLLRCGDLRIAYGEAAVAQPAAIAFSFAALREREVFARAVLAREHPASFAALYMNPAPKSDPASLWEEPLRRAVAALFCFSSRPEAEDACDAVPFVRGLLGLGPGLTPLGDDILCAWLYAAHRLAEAGDTASARFIRDIAPCVLQAPETLTTPQSAAYLHGAAKGGHFGALHDLLSSLCDAAAPLPQSAIGRLMGIGHTSGAGYALGVLLAVEMADCSNSLQS